MVKIEFVSSKTLQNLEENQKINYILSNIKKNKILVLEEPLTLKEEKELIERTMNLISKDFPGIEVSSLGGGEGFKEALIKMLGGNIGLTVIGPSNLVRELKKDPNKIYLNVK